MSISMTEAAVPQRSHLRSNQNESLLKSNFKGILPVYNINDINNRDSETASVPAAANMHGWNTPLGVHRIVCRPPGLVVTADFHRRSAAVRRKIIEKKLVHDGKQRRRSKKKEKTRDAQEDVPEGIRTPTTFPPARNILLSQIHNATASPSKKMKKNKKFQTCLAVSSRELILPPGSHVEILETVVHGGRVRGHVVWEEEMGVELDDELLAHVQTSEEYTGGDNSYRVVGAVGSEPSGSTRSGMGNGKKTKSKKFFRRKNSRRAQKNPFSPHLFSDDPCHDVVRKASPSPPPITTVKYTGWISLEWAGNNRDREEAGARHRSGHGMADDDDGPWSQPLPLGVYRICGDVASGHVPGSNLGQLPLSDAVDSDRNITDILVDSQCVEIVETRVVVMTTKISNGRLSNYQLLGMNAANGIRGVRTVRARCMVPVLIPPMVPEHVDAKRCINARPQKKFKSGWISLSADDDLAVERMRHNALPLTLGAHIVVSASGCAVTEGDRCDSKIKYVLPCKSCVEVVTTRIEFEENEARMTCHCGRESIHSVVAVRALIASGGHMTLFVFPISTSGTIDNLCYCGKFVRQTNAEPVSLGVYKITHPEGVSVTTGISTESPIISKIEEDAYVQVLQTGVEDGCVRGRVIIEEDPTKDPVAGWISLFEFPETRWAEYVYE